MVKSINDKINFAYNIALRNKTNSYYYLKGIFEEYKNIIDDSNLFELIKAIIVEYKNAQIKEDITFFTEKATELAIRLNRVQELFDIYEIYCSLLFKEAHINKCAMILQDLIKNPLLDADHSLTLKEMLLAVRGYKDLNLEELTHDLDDILTEEDDPAKIISAIISLSRKMIFEEQFDQMFSLIQKALKVLIHFKEYFKNNRKMLAEFQNTIGNIHFYFGNFIHAKRHYLRALLEGMDSEDAEQIIKYDNNIALVFFHLGWLDKSRQYFSIIEKMYQKVTNNKLLNYIYTNLAFIYLKVGKESLGFSILDSVIKYWISIEDKFTLLFVLTNAITYTFRHNKKQAYSYYLIFKQYINEYRHSYLQFFNYSFASLFEQRKYSIKLFKETVQSLLSLNTYSFRLLPPLAFIMETYNGPYRHDTRFLGIINYLLDQFRFEIGQENYITYFKTFYEYSILQASYSSDIVYITMHKIKKLIRKSDKTGKNASVTFLMEDIKSKQSIMDLDSLLSLLYIKLVRNAKISISNKLYRVIHLYKTKGETLFHQWIRDKFSYRNDLYAIECIEEKD